MLQIEAEKYIPPNPFCQEQSKLYPRQKGVVVVVVFLYRSRPAI